MGHHKGRELLYPEALMEGDLILQALNGFLLILTCDGEVFYTSHTVETYLGFHQSDICHQSVYELVHSEDREELQRHLMWNSHLPNDRSNLSMQEALSAENWHLLERNFTVRFRCLLDNTSGFLRLDIRGRIKILYGQNHKGEDPPLALFAVCTPFGPPSLLEMPQKDSMFKSKHKLDLSLVSMDQRGKQLLGFSDTELVTKGGYDLVHYDDLAYVASAHSELLKTGASGLIAYRLLTKDNKWQWLQTSARLVYKNSKPDFILCTHRPLMEEEGRDLLGKRTMDFKVTYLDGGLGAMTDRSSLLSDSDFVLRCQRNRRYKSQIKDLITNCRPTIKRKPASAGEEYSPFGDPTSASAVAVNAAHAAVSASAVGYHHNSSAAAVYPYAADNMNGLSSYAAAAAAAAMPQNLFSAIDHNSRPFLAPENFLHYSRHALGTYYPDYHHPAAQYPSNGFLEHMTSARTAHCFPSAYSSSEAAIVKENTEKLYGCQISAESHSKYNGSDSRGAIGKQMSSCEWLINSVDATGPSCTLMGSSSGIQSSLSESKLADMPCHRSTLNFGLSTPNNECLSVIKHKSSLPSLASSANTISSTMETSTISSSSPSIASAFSSTSHNLNNNVDQSRHSVLMWGSSNLSRATGKYASSAALSEVTKASPVVSCKWNGSVANPKPLSPHPSVASSPGSAKVPMAMSAYGTASAYGAPDTTSLEGWQVDTIGHWRSHLLNRFFPLQLPLARFEQHLRTAQLLDIRPDSNPLLNISEVTNTLLSH
ncbi:uncharacterized protein B4U79_15799, partial [Dinothrombium tinctorium]